MLEDQKKALQPAALMAVTLFQLEKLIDEAETDPNDILNKCWELIEDSLPIWHNVIESDPGARHFLGLD